MRVTSEVWVGALLRRANAEGAFATVLRKGAREAGAIFILLNTQDGALTLYAPAPQFSYEKPVMDRLFERVLERVSSELIEKRLATETGFDSDIWIVEIEDRRERVFFETTEPSA